MSRPPRSTRRASLSAALFLALLAALAGAPTAQAQPADAPDVLIVTAHPDDEALFAATVYALTHTLDADVDLALVTDGSGGYRYSGLAEPIYGIDLTDEATARQHLPAIRKQELMAGGQIIGLRNYFFLDQLDAQYTTDADTVLQHVWDADFVRERLVQIMQRGAYDFVLTHLPLDQNFHGHHQAATILALQAAEQLDPAERPVVLASMIGSREEDPAIAFTGNPAYPITQIRPAPIFTFDRTWPLNEDGRLNYHIVVNWLIAEHKSQGTMQLFMMRPDANLERFWVFEANPADAVARTEALFDRLRAAAAPPVEAGD